MVVIGEIGCRERHDQSRRHAGGDAAAPFAKRVQTPAIEERGKPHHVDLTRCRAARQPAICLRLSDASKCGSNRVSDRFNAPMSRTER